jgi:hypothetical protein
MATTHAAPAPHLERVIGLVEASSALAEKAAVAAEDHDRMRKEAGTLIPGIVDTLLAIRVHDGPGGTRPLLEPDEKAACAEALADPVRALQVFTKVAGHFRAAQVDSLGRSAPEGGRTKQAQSSLDSPYTGRRTSQEPESWRRFRQGIMGS